MFRCEQYLCWSRQEEGYLAARPIHSRESCPVVHKAKKAGLPEHEMIHMFHVVRPV